MDPEKFLFIFFYVQFLTDICGYAILMTSKVVFPAAWFMGINNAYCGTRKDQHILFTVFARCRRWNYYLIDMRYNLDMYTHETVI